MKKFTPRIFISNGLAKTGLKDIADFFGILYDELIEILKKIPDFFGIKNREDFIFCKVDIIQFKQLIGYIKVEESMKNAYLNMFQRVQECFESG